MKAAETWELTEKLEGANVVGSKRVFRAKKDAVEKIVRYKAGLVAQGFSQILGVDYFDMFALVSGSSTRIHPNCSHICSI